MSGLSEASMAAAEARRYSRMIGLIRCERVTGRPGSASAISSATRSSWAGLAVDHSRHTATASTPRAGRPASVARTAASSSGISTSPSAVIRSVIPNVRRRGMYGSAGGRVKSYGASRPPSRRTRTSPKPSVTSSAVVAVAPSRIALVARVVEYRNRSVLARISSPVRPSCPAASARDSARPWRGSWRVVIALPRVSPPLSLATTTSVQVPPMSTDTRKLIAGLRRAGSSRSTYA